MKKAVAYYRASTPRQGESGLGLEAQRFSVENFADFQGYELQQSFTEIESGTNSKRPELTKALELCKQLNATLLVATQSRLGRDVGLIAMLEKSKIPYKSVALPDAPKLVRYIQAAVDEDESERISIRTKEALAAAKRRGVILGKNGRDVLSKKNKEAADAFALKMIPVITDLKQQGYKTVRQIRKRLTKKRIKTYTGKYRWHVKTVHNLLKRIELLNPKIIEP